MGKWKSHLKILNDLNSWFSVCKNQIFSCKSLSNKHFLSLVSFPRNLLIFLSKSFDKNMAKRVEDEIFMQISNSKHVSGVLISSSISALSTVCFEIWNLIDSGEQEKESRKFNDENLCFLKLFSLIHVEQRARNQTLYDYDSVYVDMRNPAKIPPPTFSFSSRRQRCRRWWEN